jgi:site-specific DNA recombinase
VVAESLDRLSRDLADAATLFKHLSFVGVRLWTVAEGQITELHVGLKGTMNALYLKDLADKTRRGLRGRIEAGKLGGGNSYGYDVVKKIGDNCEPVRGERRINRQQAAIVKRVLRITPGASHPGRSLPDPGGPRRHRQLIWRLYIDPAGRRTYLLT